MTIKSIYLSIACVSICGSGIASQAPQKLARVAPAQISEAEAEKLGTALLRAVKRASNDAAALSEVQQLIADGASVDVQDEKDGSSALLVAVRLDHPKTTAVLLAAGADVNAADKDGMTPLMQAATEGHGDVVRILIAAHADLDMKSKKTGYTALIWAALGGDADMVTLLLANGADIYTEDNARKTVLDFKQISPAVRKIIEDHAAVLKAAAQGGQKKRSTNPGVEKIVRSANGLALIRVIRNYPAEIALAAVKNLIRQGADVNVQDTDQGGDTPLIAAAAFGHQPIFLNIVRELIAAGARVDTSNIVGDTALLVAARSADEATVKALLDAGAPINAQNKLDRTALMEATKNNNINNAVPIFSLLLERGAETKFEAYDQKTIFDIVKNTPVFKKILDDSTARRRAVSKKQHQELLKFL